MGHMQPDDFELPREIRGILTAYKDSLPDFEPGPTFVPGMWAKIDSRRRESLSFGRLARGFVTAAAAICLIISAALVVPPNAVSFNQASTYVDVLAEDNSEDVLIADLEPVRAERR